MSNIELRLYRYFVTLSDEKNFSRAAARLNISPPTLTHQIQKLEKELDVRLLSRKTKQAVQLTQAGMRFYESARDLLDRAAVAELNARKEARGEVGRINLGYLLSASCCGLVQNALTEFNKERPGIEVTLNTMVSSSLIEGMTGSEIDVGFLSSTGRYPAGLEWHPVLHQPMILALFHQHPLARSKRPIKPAALKDEFFAVATIKSELGFRRLTDAVAELGGFVPKISRRAPEITTLLTYVAANQGIAVVPRSLSIMRLPNVVFRDFEGSDRKLFPIVFIHRSNEKSPATRAFIEFIRRYKPKGG